MAWIVSPLIETKKKKKLNDDTSLKNFVEDLQGITINYLRNQK